MSVALLQAIFQRLIEDGFCNLVPSILITAKGMPDMATRVMLKHLHNIMPQLPILGLVDWNPSGADNTAVSLAAQMPSLCVSAKPDVGHCNGLIQSSMSGGCACR